MKTNFSVPQKYTHLLKQKKQVTLTNTLHIQTPYIQETETLYTIYLLKK